MIFASVLLRAYMDLLPGLSETLFAHDPKVGVPILVSAAGLGAIVASILIGSLTRMTTLLLAYFISMGGSLLSLTLFVATSNFWFAVGCAVLLSTSQVGVNVAGQVIVQTTVRGELRGRVMSLVGPVKPLRPRHWRACPGQYCRLCRFSMAHAGRCRHQRGRRRLCLHQATVNSKADPDRKRGCPSDKLCPEVQ